MITCEERKNRLLKANNLMKRLNLNSILVVGNGSVATNEYGFYRYFVDNRVYYHRQALVIVADETPTVCCGMPVGFGLMVFWSIVNIVMDIKKIRNGDAGLDESDSVSMKTE